MDGIKARVKSLLYKNTPTGISKNFRSLSLEGQTELKDCLVKEYYSHYSGRGVSFHDFEIAFTGMQEIKAISSLEEIGRASCRERV